MRPTLIILLALAFGAGADEKWTPLFNGKNLDGWSVKCKPEDARHRFWHVKDGAIVADSMAVAKHDYVWLMTDREFGDFVLRLKFQAFRDSPGNSGVQLRSRYDDAAKWLDGPQVDVHPPGPWRTGMIWDETRGVQRWLYPPMPKGKWVDESMTRLGLKFYFSDDNPGWNELELSAVGTKLRAVLNGVEVMSYDGAGLLDDENHKQRKVGMRGHIALQIHSNDRLRISYRDIAIRTMDEGAKR